MSAEVLREAAALMRKNAEAATPGPWEAVVSDSGLSYRCSNAWVITADLGDHIADVDYDGDAEGPHAREGCDAYYIASWHPVVAMTVADWLDNQAAADEDAIANLGFSLIDITDALAVARAYLGDQS